MDKSVLQSYVAGGAGRTFLRCWTEAVPGAIVLHAEGEVDVVTSPLLGDAIRAAFQEGSRIIVDLGDLTYLDGSGVHVLEDANRTHATQLVVVAATQDIYRLFDILGLASGFPLVRSLDAAREYFGLQ